MPRASVRAAAGAAALNSYLEVSLQVLNHESQSPFGCKNVDFSAGSTR